MKLIEVESFQISPRVKVARNTIVKFSGGGPVIVGRGGTQERMTLPGKFQVLRVLQAGKRVFLDVFGIDRVGGFHTVLVSGRSYTRHGIKWRPYKAKRTT